VTFCSAGRTITLLGDCTTVGALKVEPSCSPRISIAAAAAKRAMRARPLDGCRRTSLACILPYLLEVGIRCGKRPRKGRRPPPGNHVSWVRVFAAADRRAQDSGHGSPDRAVPPGTRGRGPRGGGALEPPDSGAPLHLRTHRRRARRADPEQARIRQTDADRSMVRARSAPADAAFARRPACPGHASALPQLARGPIARAGDRG